MAEEDFNTKIINLIKLQILIALFTGITAKFDSKSHGGKNCVLLYRRSQHARTCKMFYKQSFNPTILDHISVPLYFSTIRYYLSSST